MRSVERIELPLTRQLIIWVRRSSDKRFIVRLLNWLLYALQLTEGLSTAMHTMDFKEATDALFDRVDHEELANTLGVSIASIRQARLGPNAVARRSPPSGWREAVIRLAERRIMKCRKLIEELRDEE